jgi:hypothetical protein
VRRYPDRRPIRSQPRTVAYSVASVLTLYGVVVLSLMMLMYAFEGRHRNFVAAFAAGCALSASYGFLSGAWPFGAVESIWCVIAAGRFLRRRALPTES